MENKKEQEKEKKEILNAVYKFLNRSNLYASSKATYPHSPSISMESIGDTEQYDIVSLCFDNIPYYEGGMGVNKHCLVGFYWKDNPVFWDSIPIPMDEYPEAYEMFWGKYEKLSSSTGFGKKASKEEIEKYGEELKMFWEKIDEKEQVKQGEI